MTPSPEAGLPTTTTGPNRDVSGSRAVAVLQHPPLPGTETAAEAEAEMDNFGVWRQVPMNACHAGQGDTPSAIFTASRFLYSFLLSPVFSEMLLLVIDYCPCFMLLWLFF